MTATLATHGAATEPARETGAPPSATERVVLAHGGGGELTAALVRERFLPLLTNKPLAPLADGAILPWERGRLVFTTDSYVVTPLEFAGGDIGRLAVAGTVNDLAVMGAVPVALSLGLILEEGLPLATLDRVVASIQATCREAGVQIVAGDTKVIESRAPRAAAMDSLAEGPGTLVQAAGMFINTAGVGRLEDGIDWRIERVEAGDCVLVSGPLAEHGLTIMAAREGIEFESALRSDAAPLNGLIRRVIESGVDVKFMRDATRGGVAGVLADVCEQRQLSLVIDERAVPISPTARHAAEMFGLDPLTVANEGKIVVVVALADAERALAAMRGNEHGRDSAVIGRVTDEQPALVVLQTAIGGERIVQRPYGEELPRIC